MKQIINSLILCLLLSCNQNPKKISKTEIPTESNHKSLKLFENRDKLLIAINENDSLSTYGTEVYRFFLYTPFNSPILFRLVSNDSTFKLTTKVFYVKQPDGQGSDSLISQKEITLTTKDAISINKEFYRKKDVM